MFTVRHLPSIGLLLGSSALVAEVPDEYLETPLALAFGAPPSIGDPMLSPDGSHLLFTQQSPQGVSMLRSLSFADGALGTVLQGSVDGFDIDWCEFANETRVFCHLRQGMPDDGPNAQAFFAVNVDGSELKSMPLLLTCFRMDDLRDQPPIDWFTDDPERILFHCGRSSETSPPVLLDLYTGQEMNVSGTGDVGEPVVWEYLPGFDVPFFGRGDFGPLGRGQQFLADGHGLINMYRGRQDGLDHWFVRDDVATPWQEFLTVDPVAFEPPFRPVGYGTTLDRVFNIAWDLDSQTWALFRKDLTGEYENRLVFAHGNVDVELVDTMGKYRRVVSAAFLDGRSRRAIVDPRVAEVYAYVADLLPGLDIEILDESWDQRRYLARARAPSQAGEWLLVDMESGAVEPLGPEYEHLAAYPLAETRLIEIESSAGGSIAAHLTLPHAVAWPDPESPVPAVIMPRALPTHEDVADPHYLVQFLAASGYAVLRVNNRVEAEYGRGWIEERAIIGWRQSAADIVDAASFLVESGIAEPERICGVGRNYGAYTAIMSAIEHPEIFSCVIGISAVTDPRASPALPGSDIVNASVTGARAALNEASPHYRADELEAPLLLFHGRFDMQFRLEQHASTLRRALERADKDVVLVEYPRATHEIKRGPDRIDMLARLRAFLAEHIGPPLDETEQHQEAR